MISIRSVYVITLILCISAFSPDCSLRAQFKNNTPYPNLGDSLPDYKFYDLINYNRKEASLSDFRGKWLILDFWGYSCSACIASFPKMDKIQRHFGDRLKILFVGATKSSANSNEVKVNAITKSIFYAKRKLYNLELTTAIDSNLYLHYDVGALPQILIVSPEGKVVAKTIQVDIERLEELMNGGSPNFERSFSRSEPRRGSLEYNENLPLLTKGTLANGGNDTSFLFRSMLTRFSDDVPRGGIINLLDTAGKFGENGRFEDFEGRLAMFYRIAYLGISAWTTNDTLFYNNYYPFLKLNVRDSADFSLNSRNQYSYSLTIGRGKLSKEIIMSRLRRDLEKYFGYNGRIVKRKMPVLYLSISNKEKFDSSFKVGSDGNEVISGSYEGITMQNVTMERFVQIVCPYMYIDIPIYDMTGISEKVSVSYKADFYNEESIKNALSDYGLSLVNGTKEMFVIEVTESKLK